MWWPPKRFRDPVYSFRFYGQRAGYTTGGQTLAYRSQWAFRFAGLPTIPAAAGEALTSANFSKTPRRYKKLSKPKLAVCGHTTVVHECHLGSSEFPLWRWRCTDCQETAKEFSGLRDISVKGPLKITPGPHEISAKDKIYPRARVRVKK